MIISNLNHIERQAAMTEGLRMAFNFLKEINAGSLADGRMDIDGDKAFALIQRYVPQHPDGPPVFEYHRKYLDVQFVASGEEIIGWTHASRMKISKKYDPQKDICFGEAENGSWSPITLKAGDMALFWPADAHAPRLPALATLAASPPSQVLKIVVKVLL